MPTDSFRSAISSMVIRPRLVLLDTSHINAIVKDLISSDVARQSTARAFIPTLLSRGWLPVLCLHQLFEVLQYHDDSQVDARVRFLQSLPAAAWVTSATAPGEMGSVVDVLRAEISAAHGTPGAEVSEIRDLAREKILAFGTGIEAVPANFRRWRDLRPALAEHEQRARAITAIAPWRGAEIDDTLMSQWIGQPLRSSDESSSALLEMEARLTKEIEARGDRRISDPAAVAKAFFEDIARRGDDVVAQQPSSPAVQFLLCEGLEEGDIDPNATLGQVFDLIQFRKRLSVAAEEMGLSWPEVKARVHRERLPTTLITGMIRRYGQDQPERKGSDLNDTSLLCLAPYADVTYVDKRTLENVRRAKAKNAQFGQLVGTVRKAGQYQTILDELSDG